MKNTIKSYEDFKDPDNLINEGSGIKAHPKLMGFVLHIRGSEISGFYLGVYETFDKFFEKVFNEINLGDYDFSSFEPIKTLLDFEVLLLDYDNKNLIDNIIMWDGLIPRENTEKCMFVGPENPWSCIDNLKRFFMNSEKVMRRNKYGINNDDISDYIVGSVERDSSIFLRYVDTDLYDDLVVQLKWDDKKIKSLTRYSRFKDFM